jgi:hypothetical protein
VGWGGWEGADRVTTKPTKGRDSVTCQPFHMIPIPKCIFSKPDRAIWFQCEFLKKYWFPVGSPPGGSPGAHPGGSPTGDPRRVPPPEGSPWGTRLGIPLGGAREDPLGTSLEDPIRGPPLCPVLGDSPGGSPGRISWVGYPPNSPRIPLELRKRHMGIPAMPLPSPASKVNTKNRKDSSFMILGWH